ncbi:hypothetical protein [Polaromonas sp. JS666]|uniref:hypothetical protein n=1 Tax=Polaromonas sp. (strain JS666 / ATCC BAA-500) TaxID=296591 RepID=UPI0000536350|nr:hypothetical protein [Polaromonas sp. JS666]ABE42919.1 hypothetical protein Bpro_0963 [Polaromonas sp. JS666]
MSTPKKPIKVKPEAPTSRAIYDLGLSAEELLDKLHEIQNSDDGKALEQLRRLINKARMDPIILKSPPISAVVSLFQDLVFDVEYGATPEEIFRPVEILYRSMRGKAGGRPRKEDVWKEWRQRYEQKRVRHPSLTARERYEDIASEWESEGHTPVKWRQIQDGISELKKREK